MHGFHDCALALVFAIGLLLFGATLANAGPYEDALAGLTTELVGDTADAIDALAASGDIAHRPVAGSPQGSASALSADAKRVFIKDKSDRLTDAASGATVATPPAGIEKVRLNNRVRGMLDAALGSLTLMAKEPGRRFDAAQAVFKSRDPAALPNIDKALEKETDPRVKKALHEARAAAVLYSAEASAEDKIAAIAVIRERGDQDALGLIDGLPVDLPPAVRQAAGAAGGKIRDNLGFWSALQNAWYGLSLGSVLLLAAIGLAITFGVMGVINMAHGEMVMLGAYTTFVVQEYIRTYNPALFDYSLIIAVPLAFAVAGAVGVAIERGIIRFLYGRPLETLLATWGLSLILQQVVRTVFGPTNKEVGNPSWMSGAFESRRHHHHLQPALDHLLHAGGVRRFARHAAAARGSASKCAR